MVVMNQRAVLLLAVWLLAACAPGGAPVETQAPAVEANGDTSAQTVLSSDGVRIHYDDLGAGDPVLVFVHGWSCDRSYWSGQIEHFAQSHRVVNIDLAGHGDSGLDRAEWTMQAFGEDVSAVVTALDLNNIVLVGHSMGGKVIVEAAGQLGDRVIGVVGVDTFHGGGRETPRERQEEVFEQLAQDQAGFISTFVDRTFVEQSDPAIKEWVKADMAAAPVAAAVGARQASGNYDATPAVASLDVPFVLINSDFLPTDIAHLEANAEQFLFLEMSDVGHFLMMEDPETFNALLTAVLADIT
ncbi:MAG: alpha/beta hydrolase [Gammaproteobacteria bacterium]|nr:alpha/beta hydrolase [Gammaproteobacteria bacterium]MYF58521.1 alpha/beta hydrolase [Gammaproteobacteria bacterium]